MRDRSSNSARSKNRARWLILLVALSALATISCRQNQEHSSQADNAQSASNDAQRLNSRDREAVIGFDAIGLTDTQLHVEPSKQGWDSEIINDATGAQLELLGELLADPGRLDGEQVGRLVVSDFACVALRPDDTATAFDDSSLVVRRAAQDQSSNRDRAATYRGSAGFAQALRDLLAPLKGASDVHSKFKVFRVSGSDNAATTHAYYELSGRTEAGIVQQRAVWQCRWRRSSEAPPRLESIEVSQYEEATGKSASGPLFADCTEAVLGAEPAYRDQLAYSIDHWLDRIEFRYGIDPSAWLGMAVGDVNGDELDDVYVCQPGGLPNRLFVQLDDATATDMSASAGVDWLDHTQAALIVDLDNDSDQDLVLAMKLGLIFMSNDGKGRFKVETTKLIPETSPYSLSASDFDNDGDLDVYACCYSVRGLAPERRFLARPIPYHDANNGGRNVLFRNAGQWRFQDVTKPAGLDQNNRRFSFASSWEDYDNDGDLDLYVANDYGRNNLYRNDGGRFADVAARAGVEDIAAGMSVSWGDYDNDGRMDLYVSNMFSSAGNRIAYQRRFHAEASDSTRAEFQRHARGNSLFQNAGDGTFRDVSESAGVTMGRWAWGSGFVDVNNDGLEDLVVANGFVTQEDPGDL